MWVERPRLAHTHNLAGTIVPKRVAPPLTPAVYQGPAIATVWACPTPVYIHTASYGQTTHTHPKQSRCVPFSDPHVHKVATSRETKLGCTHSSANTLGPAHHMARTHQTDDKSKGWKRRGTSAKSSVLMLTCVPLPHLVLPLSGCACSSTPTMATRGEARGHP